MQLWLFFFSEKEMEAEKGELTWAELNGTCYPATLETEAKTLQAQGSWFKACQKLHTEGKTSWGKWYSVLKNENQKADKEAGEVARWLIARPAPSEDLRLIPSTLGWLTTACNYTIGYQMPSSDPVGILT